MVKEKSEEKTEEQKQISALTNVITMLVRNAKNFGMFATMIGVIVSGAWWTFTFYNKIDVLEKEFPIVKERNRVTQRKLDSVLDLMGDAKLFYTVDKDNKRLDTMWTHIKNLYRYKQPYGQYGGNWSQQNN
jgi:hypothetical protein